MSDAVILDSGPLGILANPNYTPTTTAFHQWVRDLLHAGRRVIIPEISDYEIRRELTRAGRTRSLSLLDAFETQLEYLPLNTQAMRLAAELWALARNTGQQTASNHALDGDMILVAQTIVLGVPAIIATGNVADLSQFVPAEEWTLILP